MFFADIVGFLAAGAFLTYVISRVISSNSRNRAVSKAPPGAGVLPGDTRVEARTKEDNYRMLMRAVHILDIQLLDDDIRPFLPKVMQEQMKSVVDDFFNR